MTRATALLLVALLGACDDGPAGPEPVREVEIVLNSLPFDAESLQVGETVQLDATLTDAGGRPLIGRPVAWRSTAPSVAEVDSTGRVTAVSIGMARILASADLASDTVFITVTARSVLPDEVACASGAPTLDLALGQVMTFRAQEQPLLCIDGGVGSEYALIPFHAAASVGTLAVEVAAAGLVPAVGPPTPSLLPGGLALSMGRTAGTAPAPDRGFDRRLREWEGRNFASLRASRSAAGIRPSFSRAARAAPKVGDTLHLNVNATSGCGTPDTRVGRVEAVTQHAIVVADTANPEGGFDRDEYRAFGVTFDTLVWRVDTRNFGEPEDLDENEKVMIFFTRGVNELTEPNSNSVVGGFFFGRDLFEPASCAGSNRGELFYMLVPDPNGLVNENRRTKEAVAGSTVAVLAHEFQHLINFSRRLFVNNASEDEDTWLNEGLSHIAEELVFYEAASLLPETNVEVETLRASQSVFDKFLEYEWSNFGRYISYLEDPATASPLADDDELSTRGATWAFLRYAADRKADPGAQRQLWFDLVNSRTSGVQNLQNVFGVNPIDWLEDWTVSVYTDDTPLLVSARYRQPSWSFRSILGPGGLKRASTGQPLFPVFPLDAIPLADGEANRREFRLKGGGAAFLRFGVAPGGTAAIRTSSGGVVAPSWLRVMLVRTK